MSKKQRDMLSSIHRVSIKQLQEIVYRYSPYGLFLTQDKNKWIAVDNSRGDAWTEEFCQKHQAVSWLLGEFEVGAKEAAK